MRTTSVGPSVFRSRGCPRRRHLVAVVVCIGCLLSVVPARAQSGPPDAFGEIGIHKDHNYFSPEPYEHYDTVSGNVLVTFTDLALPGNAGRQLQFQRTYNNRGGSAQSRWTFGIAGMVMRIIERSYPADDFPFNDDLVLLKGWSPTFVTADGAIHPTIFTQRPNTDTATTKAETMRMVISAQFYKYDRTEYKLYMPDGTICEYESGGVDSLGNPVYVLKNVRDAFDNQVELLRSPNAINPTTITVRQHLSPTEVRDVVLDLDSEGRVELMTYGARQWDYVYGYEGVGVFKDITTVTAPEGQQWTFGYVLTGPTPDIEEIITPNGGRIHYEWQDVEITPVPSDPTQNFMRHLLRYRDSYDRNDVPLGHWELDWGNDTNDVDFSWNTIITTPSGVVYFHHGAQVPGGYLFTGGFGRMWHTVGTEAVTDEYTTVPLVRYSPTVWWGTPEIRKRTIQRDGQTYVTEYEYDQDTSDASKFPWNLHRPTFIRENPPTSTRIVERSYTKIPANADARVPGRYILGLPSVEKISVGTTFQRSWQYQPTGFLEWTKDFSQLPDVEGIETTFGTDGSGNVTSVTKGNGKTTTFTYSYGRVKDTITGEYTIGREIRPDGTVQSETQAGRTTTFDFDLLFRPTLVQPPGVFPTNTHYDDVAGTVTTTRGTSWTRTTVDGFGRPVGTINSRDVQTTMAYDAEGRVKRQGYPFVGGPDIGTQIAYDALGRVTRETNPDDTYRQRTYNGNTVTIRDENGHETVQTFQAFGHPDDKRLVTLKDAKNQSWSYAYDALNALTAITTPDGLFRTWQYNSKHLLDQETHPESGTTTSAYDAAGVLTQKTDANNVTTSYAHDQNDRVKTITAGTDVTTFTYEPGSDNRLSANQGGVSTAFSYDAAGRVATRTDTVDGYVFTTTFGYNGNDSLTSVFYPSFGPAGSRRQIGYDHDSEQRIIRVADLQVNRNFASDFTYHASGAVTSYVAGNNVTSVFNYDPQRYWLTSVNVGSLWQLQYQNYDGVGNVRALVDSRGPALNQTFQYDELDRLKTATGATYYPSAVWEYDVHGNRQDANLTTYTYYPSKLRLWTQNTDTFSYDNNGNLLTVVGTVGKTFTYTPRDTVATATVGGVQTSYAYDVDNWRVKKKSGTTTTYYLRGLNGELLTEWTNPGPSGETKDYIYAGSRLISVISRTWSQSSDFYGEIIPNGPAVTVDLMTPPGRDAKLKFDGIAGEFVTAQGSLTTGGFGCNWGMTILKPDGTALPSPNGTYSWGCSYQFLQPIQLPDTGTYTLKIDQYSSSGVGIVDVNLYSFVHLTGTIAINGPAVTPNIIRPGQEGHYTFNGTQGQRVSAFITVNGNYNCGSFLSIRKPDGTPLTSVPYEAYACSVQLLGPVALPSTGQYTLVVDPTVWGTGASTVNLYEVVDQTGAITLNGPSVTATITTPGQNGAFEFTGAVGQRVSMYGLVTSGSYGCGTFLQLLKPDGTALWASSGGSCGAIFVEPATLPAPGVYKVVVNPSLNQTGTSSINAYDVAPDASASATVNEAAVPVSITSPGQNATITFAGTQGQQVTVHFTGNTIGTGGGSPRFIVKNPNGSWLTSTWSGATAFNMSLGALGSTGNYTIVVDPQLKNVGGVTVQVTSP